MIIKIVSYICWCYCNGHPGGDYYSEASVISLKLYVIVHSFDGLTRVRILLYG